jgi:hypothetical protein
MKSIVVVFFLLVTLKFYAQGITLNQIDFANGGDTVRTSSAPDNEYDYQSTGADYIWDFSALSATSQNLTNFYPMSEASLFVLFDFGWFASQEYQASYFKENNDLPIAQITSFLPISIQSILQYSKSSPDSITNVGYSMNIASGGNSFDLAVKSDTIETYYKFPLSYGDSNYTRSYSQIDFNPIYNAIWNQHKERSTIVDGFGILTTPYGTFNVLRLKHEIIETDSIYTELPFIGATWIPLDLPLVREYEWWTIGEKIPILKITTNEVFGNESITAIGYKDNYLGLDAGLNEKGLDFSLYPVPTSDLIRLTSSTPFDAIEIIDHTGRSIVHQDFHNAMAITFDVRDLARGVYELRLYTEKSVTSKKFIKE